MNKQSKVTKVTGNGTWSPKNDASKVFYAYEIEMENGDTGTYNSIKDQQTKFIEGEIVEYSFTGGEYPKIKPVYNMPMPTDNNCDMSRSVAIKSASTLFAGTNFSTEKVIDTARQFEDYINNGCCKKTEKTTDVPF